MGEFAHTTAPVLAQPRQPIALPTQILGDDFRVHAAVKLRQRTNQDLQKLLGKTTALQVDAKPDDTLDPRVAEFGRRALGSVLHANDHDTGPAPAAAGVPGRAAPQSCEKRKRNIDIRYGSASK